MVQAEYQCVKCNYDWKQVQPSMVQCPMCNHSYVVWTNYKEAFASRVIPMEPKQ